MKTKTGQLLMMKSKSRNPQSLKVDSTKQNNSKIITPLKHQKQPQVNLSKEKDIKYKHGQEQPQTGKQKVFNQEHLIVLQQENKQLCEEIQRLRQQCSELKEQMTRMENQRNANQQQLINERNRLEQQRKENVITSLKESARKTLQQQRIVKCQEKLSILEVQNYRLIESNYLLLIKLKKGKKSYKDTLLKIANMLENLDFTEASKEIYESLEKMRHEQGEGEEMGIMKEEIRMEKINKEENIVKKQTNKKLTLASCVYTQRYFVQPSIEQKQNSIQLNLRHLPTTHHRQPSNSFHLISQPAKSDPEFAITKKLFNSQIHETFSVIDQSPSIRDKMEYWENGTNLNKSNKQMTVHKCYGNSMELYKMLMVQAAAIESFF